MENGASRDIAKPFSSPPQLDKLVGNVRILEEWYSATFRRRIAEFTELLSTQISEELRSQFELERKSLFERSDVQSASIIESLKNEIERLKRGSHMNDGLCEIDRIEKKISEVEAELEHSFTVDSVPLSRLLHLCTTQSDLKSYLRGLKFFAGKSGTESKPEAEPSLRS
jgi:hypothetical protein